MNVCKKSNMIPKSSIYPCINMPMMQGIYLEAFAKLNLRFLYDVDRFM